MFPRHKEAPISAPDHVPKELKNRMKKAHGARGLLEELEREVRAYIIENEEREEESEAESEDTTSYYGEGEEVVVQADSDSEEEIVFVSKRERGGAGGGRGKVLIRSAEEDERGSFG